MERQILINISQLVTPEGRAAKYGSAMNESKKIMDAAVVVEDGRIAFVGTTAEVKNAYQLDGEDRKSVV